MTYNVFGETLNIAQFNSIPFRTRTDWNRHIHSQTREVTDAAGHPIHSSATTGVGFIATVRTIVNDLPCRQLHGVIAMRGYRVCSSGEWH